jgi:hypothetical protein
VEVRFQTVEKRLVKVSLEVEAETDEGFTRQIVGTISENCRTLRKITFFDISIVSRRLS